jgi:hypothetical protein
MILLMLYRLNVHIGRIFKGRGCGDVDTMYPTIAFEGYPNGSNVSIWVDQLNEMGLEAEPGSKPIFQYSNIPAFQFRSDEEQTWWSCYAGIIKS